MKTYTTECVVLKSKTYKDNDKLYTLFSKEKGKIMANAKGVRRIKSKRSGNLDTLNHLYVGISENGDFKTITEVKSIKTYKEIKKSLDTIKHAYYICELVYRFTEEEDTATNRLFALLIESLEMLEEGKLDLKTVESAFELNFLKILGYQMSSVDRSEQTIKNFIKSTLGQKTRSHEIFSF